MKRYVYFVCAAIHYSDGITTFRNYEVVRTSEITNLSDITSISEEIKADNKKGISEDISIYVSVVNYQLLREEETKE